MDRAVVIGRPGAGKSTLAVALGRALEIPVFHLDRLFWNSGWRQTPREEFIRRQVGLMADHDRWIMDGNYVSTLPVRLARCDGVIYLDLPPIICLRRVIGRTLRNRLGLFRRRDLPSGCPERPLSRDFFRFLTYVHRFPAAPRVDRLLDDLSGDVRVCHLRSAREADCFLATVVPRAGRKMRTTR